MLKTKNYFVAIVDKGYFVDTLAELLAQVKGSSEAYSYQFVITTNKQNILQQYDITQKGLLFFNTQGDAIYGFSDKAFEELSDNAILTIYEFIA